MPDSPRTARRLAERTLVALITAAAFALFTLYSIATPLFEASDELWHYPMVMHLATGGGLPVQRAGQTDADAPWRQEGSQPPLYYAVAALVSAPFDHSNWREIRRVNPHTDMGVPTRDGNANAVLHAPAEAFPWTRAALAARAARLVSILMSTTTVLFCYFVARELWPGGQHLELRLAAMILAACVPMFAFISGSINNDNAAVLFSTVGLWWALRIVRVGELSARSALIAGAIAGLGALSKSSSLGLLGLFGLSALIVVLRGAFAVVSPGAAHGALSAVFRPLLSALRPLLPWFALCLAITALISGWWFVRNVQLYGDLLGWNAFLDVVGRRDMPATLAQLWTEREGFVWAFWGVFGTLNVIYPPWLYTLLNGLAVLALLGLLNGFSPRLHRRFPVLRPQLVLSLVWLIVIFVALLRWTALTPASQGRLMFPAIAVIAAGMAYGLWRLHRVLLGLGVALMVVVSVWTPFGVIAPAYARPAAAWRSRLPLPVNQTFGGALTVVEAGATHASTQPGEEITLQLNWSMSATLPVNASVFVHLIDENDVIVAQRDMHPGQGALPLAEVAAPYRWTDRYTLRVSRLAHAPRQLRWALGVYDYASGSRLTTASGADRVLFGSVQLKPASGGGPLLSYANGAALTQIDGLSSAAAPGGLFTVRTHWQAARPIGRDYNLSLQLIDEQNNKIAQHDVGAPMSQWKAGREAAVLDHALTVVADARPGVYRLLLVMYVPEGAFPKVAAYDDRGQYAGEQITLARVRIR
jgi:4-amino-4-deoxy-L-arabinose transferase-like glycosyltransferase